MPLKFPFHVYMQSLILSMNQLQITYKTEEPNKLVYVKQKQTNIKNLFVHYGLNILYHCTVPTNYLHSVNTTSWGLDPPQGDRWKSSYILKSFNLCSPKSTFRSVQVYLSVLCYTSVNNKPCM